jgi:hypothetical protein
MLKRGELQGRKLCDPQDATSHDKERGGIVSMTAALRGGATGGEDRNEGVRPTG